MTEPNKPSPPDIRKLSIGELELPGGIKIETEDSVEVQLLKLALSFMTSAKDTKDTLEHIRGKVYSIDDKLTGRENKGVTGVIPRLSTAEEYLGVLKGEKAIEAIQWANRRQRWEGKIAVAVVTSGLLWVATAIYLLIKQGIV